MIARRFAVLATLALAPTMGAHAQDLLKPSLVNPASTPTVGTQSVPRFQMIDTAQTPDTLDQFGLPAIDHAGPGNVAGMMAYCVSNHLAGGTTARVVGRKLAARADVRTDPYYSLGGQGLLQRTGNPFNVNTLDRDHRAELCAQLTQRTFD